MVFEKVHDHMQGMIARLISRQKDACGGLPLETAHFENGTLGFLGQSVQNGLFADVQPALGFIRGRLQSVIFASRES